jgi:hypothetical protein
MPYALRKTKTGTKVVSPNREFSKKGMSHRQAVEQLRAIMANTKGK